MRIQADIPRNVVAAIGALLALLVLALPVSAPAATKAIEYEGKTGSGHDITFTLKKKRLYDMESGIAVSCIPIQGSGPPSGGVETFSYEGWVPLSPKPVDFEFMKKPAVYYNEVTAKHSLSSKIVNHRTGLITGTQRIQYSYFLPKFPFPSFAIYSCLGEGTFRAKPVAGSSDTGKGKGKSKGGNGKTKRG
jgi:hypothetical protein